MKLFRMPKIVKNRVKPSFECENNLWEQGHELVAGIDEVGRGAWAGPVVAGVVVWKKNSEVVDGINDSKILGYLDRERLAKDINRQAFLVGIGEASNLEIDERGILVATKLAMERALNSLPVKPDFLLVDALKICWSDVPCQPIIKGDQKSVTIAAASIVAKVYRDELMTNQESKFKDFSFGKHKGYGTKLHQEEIKKFGLTKIHRNSFKCFAKKTGGLFDV